MTGILLDPNDTGEIINRTQLDQARTERIDIGESTRNLAPYIGSLAPKLRRPHPAAWTAADSAATGEIPYADAGLTLLQEPPTGPPPPPPPTPKPGWAQPASHHAVVRRRLAKPKPGRGRHRAAAPLWTRVALWVGVPLLVFGGVGVVVLAAFR